jgi:hypothetical protein
MIPRHLFIGVVVLLVAVLGMSIYAWHMRGRVAAIPAQPAADTRALVPTFTGPTERATLFVAFDEDGSLRPRSAQISLPSGRQQRAEELLSALLTIYLNSAFADGHRSGVLVEDLTVTSLIHTLSANIPGILKVKILVDGKERETLAGHADLTGFYDVTAVNQLSTQLQPVQ